VRDKSFQICVLSEWALCVMRNEFIQEYSYANNVISKLIPEITISSAVTGILIWIFRYKMSALRYKFVGQEL
jgi:hypothetical protein